MKLKNLQPLFMAVLVAGSLNSVAQTSNVAVAPTKLNVLYIGVENPVAIAVAGATDDKVSVSITGGGGLITKKSAGNYVVMVMQATDDCAIQVAVDGKPAGTSKFRVRTLPDPYATIGGFPSGANVTADAFKQQAGLGLYLRDFPFDVKFEVVSFAITMEDNNKNLVEANCVGSMFSDRAKQIINELVKPGKTVTIDKILAKNEAGKTMKIPSLVYYIK